MSSTAEDQKPAAVNPETTEVQPAVGEGEPQPPPLPPPVNNDVKVEEVAAPALPSIAAAAACPVAPPAAAATGASPKKTFAMPDFLISEVRKKNASGATLCMAVGCEKNAQARTQINDIGGFCRVHYNAWLIGSGQISSWDCLCGNKVSDESDRCGNCHRWKGGKHMCKPKKPKAQPRDNGSETLLTHVPESSGFKISNVRELNDKGRTVCKVVGCMKLDQAKNDGFCRTHFNMFQVPSSAVVAGGAAALLPSAGPNSGGDGSGDGAVAIGVQLFNLGEDWTCGCGKVVPGKQKRCGGCNKWRGGKREPYKTKSMKERVVPSDIQLDTGTLDEGHWNCAYCENKISTTKSRCGKCHRWRGGKRKGGWKIKINVEADDSGIEWDKDWTCCAVMIPAAKKRCGKCNGWRGGKRVAGGKPAAKKAKTEAAAGPVKKEVADVPMAQVLESNAAAVPALPAPALPANTLPSPEPVAAEPVATEPVVQEFV